jgi:hypothetical protein
MTDRNQLAAELLEGCPADSLDDHQAVAAALLRGDSNEQVLGMDQLDAWPETYSWLKGELSEANSKITDIEITIGQNDHESDRYINRIFIPRLEAAVETAFPDASVSVEFVSSSPVLEIVVNGGESDSTTESRVQDAIANIRERLWTSPDQFDIAGHTATAKFAIDDNRDDDQQDDVAGIDVEVKLTIDSKPHTVLLQSDTDDGIHANGELEIADRLSGANAEAHDALARELGAVAGEDHASLEAGEPDYEKLSEMLTDVIEAAQVEYDDYLEANDLEIATTQSAGMSR